METIEPTGTELKRRFRRLLFTFGLSGIVLMATLSGALVMKRYIDSLYATFDKLQEFNIQYIKVRAAVDHIDKSLTRLKSMLPVDSPGQVKEEHMLIALDDLKTKAGSSEITVANIEDKGTDLQLPVIIRSPLKDYTSFANFVGYLQSLKFPFFGITGITIHRSDDQVSSVPFLEIKGVLKFPKTTSGIQVAPPKKVSGKL